MKIALITGITGQLGSYLSELLLKDGDYKVIGIIRRSSTNTLERIAHIKDKLVLEEGDITDGFCMNSLITRYNPDLIFHTAAQSHVHTSFSQPNLTWDVTAGGLLNILEAMRITKSSAKLFNCASSEMFGKNYSTSREFDGMTYIEKKYQNEHTPMIPQSPYAIAKLAAFHLVRLYRESYGLFACSAIMFNYESPRRGENFVTRKITKYIGRLVNNNKNNIETPKLKLGNLKAKRDWGYAGDVAKAALKMLEQKTPDDYVISTGETHSIEEFLTISFSLANLNWKDYVEIDPELYRPAEVDYLLGDSSKAREKLGWSPDCKFVDLVKMMVEHDINNS